MDYHGNEFFGESTGFKKLIESGALIASLSFCSSKEGGAIKAPPSLVFKTLLNTKNEST